MTGRSPQQLTPPGGWRMAPRVRIPPLHNQGTGIAQRLLIRAVERFGRLDAGNLWRMMLHNARLLRGFLVFAPRLMPYGELPRRDTELVILRVAWNCRARYEWGQHVDIGLRAGLSPAEVARVPHGPAAPGWDSRQAALLAAADEFHQERMVTEPTWQQLEQLFDKRLLLELLMLIGFYEGLAGFLNSTGVPLDAALEQRLAGLSS